MPRIPTFTRRASDAPNVARRPPQPAGLGHLARGPPDSASAPGARGGGEVDPGRRRGIIRPAPDPEESPMLILHDLAPWPWWLAGAAIGAITLLLLWVGNQ